MRRRDGLLWICAIGAPAAWFGDLVAHWAFAPGAHEEGSLLDLHLMTASALLVATTCGAVAWLALRGMPRTDDPESTATPAGTVAGEEVALLRARFMARAAIALAIFSVLLILATALPALLLSPGQEP